MSRSLCSLCVLLALLLGATVVAAAAPPPAPAPAPEALAQVDRALLDALKAPDSAQRKRLLAEARARLDALPQAAQGPASSAENTMLEHSAALLATLEQRTARQSRQTLMGVVWESPYGHIPAADLQALERISRALRLLKALRATASGDAAALAGLVQTYWDWLLRYRAESDTARAATDAAPDHPVFEQRALRAENGQVVLYRLVGSPERTLRWVAVPAPVLPADALGVDALRLNLKLERAPFLLVLEGPRLAELLSEHRLWLEQVQAVLRLVLLDQDPQGQPCASEAPAAASGATLRPYLIPVPASTEAPRLTLVETASGRQLAAWPLQDFHNTQAASIKALINLIIAIGTTRTSG